MLLIILLAFVLIYRASFLPGGVEDQSVPILFAIIGGGYMFFKFKSNELHGRVVIGSLSSVPFYFLGIWFNGMFGNYVPNTLPSIMGRFIFPAFIIIVFIIFILAGLAGRYDLFIYNRLPIGQIIPLTKKVYSRGTTYFGSVTVKCRDANTLSRAFAGVSGGTLRAIVNVGNCTWRLEFYGDKRIEWMIPNVYEMLAHYNDGDQKV